MDTIVNKGGEDSLGKRIKIGYCEDGRVIWFNVPDFDGPKTTIEDAYTDETWAAHGNDTQNYRWQMDEGAKEIARQLRSNPQLSSKFSEEEICTLESGKAPKGYTMHHAYTKNNGRDLVMQLVKTGEHKEQHYGASFMANPQKRENEIKKAGNWNSTTKLERCMNKANFFVHQHQNAVATGTGVIAGAATYWTTKKIKNKYARAGISVFVGAVVGVAVKMFLGKDNDTIIYG